MKRIVVIGPESTGKSTLARGLAFHFDCPWIPEYARSYMEGLNRPYTYEDVELIARHQLEELRAYETRFSTTTAPYLFLDTDLIITRVWFLHVFKREPQWLDTAINSTAANLYLLCRPDLPWEPDPVRENESIRDYLYQWYMREIKELGKPFAEIGGKGEQRLQHAIQAIH
ncbi:MAG: ATP-binding protein [Paludibacteraceae bacterium]|nr:ATP-binding protein [Paludibacteraceae bacterium]